MSQQLYPEFNTHTPPDITPNTRILAVCGTHPKDAGPGTDGWFLADFFAFYHLFRGMTKSQKWMHGLDLQLLVDKHTRYLHGSPFKTKKVVLDKGILEMSTQAEDLTYVPIENLRLRFKQQLVEEVKAAAAGNQSLLVLIFAHGDIANGGFLLGQGATVTQFEFSKAISGHDVPISIMSTACYSGGWSCNNQYNRTSKHYNKSKEQFEETTTMVAVPKEASVSWNDSTTLDRACGSMFATAIIKAMTRTEGRRHLMEINEEDEKENTEEQAATHAAFTKTVYETLLEDVDRRGFVHEITFSAEDDAWELCWRERTGIPLAQFKTRWDSLKDFCPDPHMHPEDPQALDKRKTNRIHGLTAQAMIKKVSYLGHQYLQSYKGVSDTANDGYLHKDIHRIIHGYEKDPDIVDETLRAIEYRMTQISTADKYLQMMSLEAPLGQACHAFHTPGIRQTIDSATEKGRYRSLLNLVYEQEVLFPVPCEDQGHRFSKGHCYLVAAFFFANLDRKQIVQKLDALASEVAREIEYRVKTIEDKPDLKRRRIEMYQAHGLELGAILP